jgi:hypothetical protein
VAGRRADAAAPLVEGLRVNTVLMRATVERFVALCAAVAEAGADALTFNAARRPTAGALGGLPLQPGVSRFVPSL